MKASLGFILFSLLGAIVASQYTGTVYPTYQKNGQVFTLQSTTPSSIAPTTVSLTPKTSVSVHHTIVRNRPAYPYPYTDSTLQSDDSEETSYYYTYEDTSEENKSRYTTTPMPTTSTPTARSTVRSFWNSQRAQLEARRKESPQKFLPTHNRPTPRTETKPKVEFKVREKPKFGFANKNKETTTTTDSMNENSQNVATTTPKSVKNNINEANLSEEKTSKRENSTKSIANQNQILGRVGEIPVQNKYSTQIQTPLQAQSTVLSRFGTSRQSKFDESTGNDKFIGNSAKLQQPSSSNSINPLGNRANQQSPLTPEQFLANLNKQLPLQNLNQKPMSNQPIQNNKLQTLLSQQLPNTNQQRLSNTNQQPGLDINLLSLLLNKQQKPSAFVSTSPAFSAARSAEPVVDTGSAASTFLSRLGSLGLGGLGGNAFVLERDGGHDGQGLTFNLGPVADPLTILLKLLSLIPRPILDLNGRIFFGIELGKNAGLVSGAAKPPLKPIG
ncbi:uncharacterized protein TNIN_276231 [Trichonephila inaurata madagascariensis]|uniref:Uncharacterized protein n=1 Tax=Trichonephila inaurata madagascariensis TaxID=2747483 RepID=A0A8X7C7D3_9ARAC|nr:uncharacterized protein TNIN_276231 [Trichonephila inaurata madagascariensis]